MHKKNRVLSVARVLLYPADVIESCDKVDI